MKNIFALILCLLSFQTFAAPSLVDVVSTHIGVEDDEQRKSLCLTVIRVPGHNSLVGVVEDIRDCFYARSAKRSLRPQIQMNLPALKEIDHLPLRQHLQKLDTQLEFYFSDGE